VPAETPSRLLCYARRRLRTLEAKLAQATQQVRAQAAELRRQRLGLVDVERDRARLEARVVYLAERGRRLAQALRKGSPASQAPPGPLKARRPPWQVRARLTLAQPAWIREAIKPGGLIG